MCKQWNSEQVFNHLCFIELQQTGSYKEQAGFLVAVQYSWYMSEHDTKAAAGKEIHLSELKAVHSWVVEKWNYALDTRKSQHDKYNFAVTVILPKISLWLQINMCCASLYCTDFSFDYVHHVALTPWR